MILVEAESCRHVCCRWLTSCNAKKVNENFLLTCKGKKWLKFITRRNGHQDRAGRHHQYHFMLNDTPCPIFVDILTTKAWYDVKLGNRYPPVGALAYRQGKARAFDLPTQFCNACTDQLNRTSSQSDWFQNLEFKAQAEWDHKANCQNISAFEKKSCVGRGWKECKIQSWSIEKISIVGNINSIGR